MRALVPVILSGGGGSRLWPLSRADYPKQCLALTGDKTLLQQTVVRAAGINGTQPPLILCNEDCHTPVARQLDDIGAAVAGFMLEPQGRNTAPAIALAALYLQGSGQDPVMLIMPSDHHIEDDAAFQSAIALAVVEAENGAIATLGVVPTSPDTGYGYIVGSPHTGTGARQVARFIEKPNLPVAEDLILSKDCFWNSGIFVFKPSVFLAALKTYAPEIFDTCQRATHDAVYQAGIIRPDASAFLSCPSQSIDYAIMEKTDRAVVIPLDAGWCDIGSWQRLWALGKKDSHGNVLLGDVVCENTKGSYIHATSCKVSAIGLDHVVVVETPEAVLVTDRAQGEEAATRIVIHPKDLPLQNDEPHIRHWVVTGGTGGIEVTEERIQRFRRP